MEIFMHNLPLDFGEDEIKAFLASLLHGQYFDFVQTNFAVHLHRRRKFNARAQTGTFTVADAAIGAKFLSNFGYPSAVPVQGTINRLIHFKKSNHDPRPEIVETISRTPWIDPVKEREQKEKDEFLSSSSVSISSIQFGWQCRDEVVSIEAEANRDADLQFDSSRREIHVVTKADDLSLNIIAIRYTSIHSISRHRSTVDGNYVLFFELRMPPTFLRKAQGFNFGSEATYSRMSTFPHLDNPRAISFTGLALRLVFTSEEESDKFSKLSETAGIRRVHINEVIIERRGLFSATHLDALERNLRKFNWNVAFQLLSLLQNMILDTSELLDLLPRVKEVLDLKGKNYTAKLLKEFRNVASGLWYSDDYNENISSCFNSVEQEFKKQGDMLSLIPDDGSYYQSLHVIITPTTMFLNGPYPERSNRVIRKYASENHENFLRVTFRDENHLQYRFDREVDGPRFIRERVGVFLKNGLKIASRAFEFLAYSQSALKEHSVWYAGFNLSWGYLIMLQVCQSIP